MRYRSDISGEEYAAMEEGYDQGRAAADRELQEQVDRLTKERDEARAAVERVEALATRWETPPYVVCMTCQYHPYEIRAAIKGNT